LSAEHVAAAVGVADQERGDQYSGDGNEVDDELGRLDRGLRLGAGRWVTAADDPSCRAWPGVLRDKTTP
jgi:hypothetical protein